MSLLHYCMKEKQTLRKFVIYLSAAPFMMSRIQSANHVPAPSSMQFTADPCLHESIFFPAMTSWAEMKLGRNEKPSWRFIVNYLGNILLEFGHRMIPHFSRIWDGFSFRPSFISAHDVIAGKKMDSCKQRSAVNCIEDGGSGGRDVIR